ncbi:MAG: sulfite exporter TauE/SafE family protein [bacterium]
MEHLPSFLIGLAGATQSLGAYGGFALSPCLLNQDRTRRVFALSLYSSGCIFTYVFLGALAGMTGRALTESQFLTSIHQPVILLAGALLLLVSMQMMGFRAPLNLLNNLPGSTILERFVGRYQGQLGQLAPFYLGLFNGFLPHPLVYAGLAIALASANVPRGMFTMFLFALGTLPLLWLIGTSGFLFPPITRARLVHAMAIVVLAVGCVLVWRGLSSDSIVDIHLLIKESAAVYQSP